VRSGEEAASGGGVQALPGSAGHRQVRRKAQTQALERSAPILPLLPGVPQRQSHDYVRNGTANLYAALEVASGKVIADTRNGIAPRSFAAFPSDRCLAAGSP